MTDKIIRDPQGAAAKWVGAIKEQYESEQKTLSDRAQAIGLTTTIVRAADTPYKLESETIAQIRQHVLEALSSPSQDQVQALATKIFHSTAPVA